MTNTAGAIPGIIGVVTTGAILDQTGSWPLALFVPSIFFFVTGAGCNCFGGRGPFTAWTRMARMPGKQHELCDFGSSDTC
jgi:hypothetical protein